MIRYTTGNLLDAATDAIVNTVNTTGVMGKGIALMFKERYPENFKAYAAACKGRQVELGRMFVTESPELSGPRWIINFPTKGNWRFPSKLEWIESGLEDLKRVVAQRGITSIAIPPLGAGNGGLDWREVRALIEKALSDLPDVDVLIYEPTAAYQNVSKTTGVERLTPARAVLVEMIRRYESLGLECSLLETQKLAWMLHRMIDRLGMQNTLGWKFEANRYGPYADNVKHLLNALDGSFLHCRKRIADAGPWEILNFAPDHEPMLRAYLATSEAAAYRDAIERTDALIDGFQSPLGMEALATVDWLLSRDNAEPTVDGIRRALSDWPTEGAAARKQGLFTDELLQAAIDRLTDDARS